jgi:signal transduction histidine kinase
MNPLGLRRRLLVALLATAVVVVAALVAGFNLLLATTLDGNARDLARSRADAQRSALRVENGRLATGEAADDRSSDAYVWVFAGRRALERPRVGADLEAAVRRLVGGAARFADLPATDTRLYALPVLVAGRRAGTVVAGVSLAPYEETRETALIASLIFGGIVIVLGTGFGWWLLGASLRPVVRMTRQASAWSEHELDHRFALGAPHDELTELAATLDALLDRVASGLRRERRFSAELSHELRTPLARILAQSEHALRRDRTPPEYRRTLELVHGNADRLSRTVDALVAAARYEAGGDRGTADAESVAAGAAAACAGIAEERGIAVEVAPPPRTVRVGVDTDLAERILQPVIENACRYGSTRVRVALARADGSVLYAVEDDGPGVDETERERIFEPGVRGRAAAARGDSGAGLGLSLARRLARSVDGDVAAVVARGGRFTVRLPRG